MAATRQPHMIEQQRAEEFLGARSLLDYLNLISRLLA